MSSTSLIKTSTAIALTLLCLNACSQKLDTHLLAGRDKDAHSCIGSAGYLWCIKENACVRPWELAKDKGFENTEEDIKKYCGRASKLKD